MHFGTPKLRKNCADAPPRTPLTELIAEFGGGGKNVMKGDESKGKRKKENGKGRGLVVPQRQISGYIYACMQDGRDHADLSSHPR